MRRTSTLALVFVISSTAVLHAQSTDASLAGCISDPSKARIVGATVVAISVGTNSRYETKSNGSGQYYLPNLPPGGYYIEVEKAGFKKLVKPDVNLHVQDAIEIDFEMPLGVASDTVTVVGGAPLLNSSDASVSTLI